MAININNLAGEINRQLQLYTGHTNESIDKVAKQVAIDGVEKLKAASPRRYGDYAESWTYRKVGRAYVVHNKEHYRLTHLLEKSHALIGGGRTRKFIHIKPTEEKMIQEFEDGLRRELSE